MEVKIEEAKLRRFCENILKKTGLSDKDACTVADSLLFANLRGIDSHGIMRFPFYVQRLKQGGTKTKPVIAAVSWKITIDFSF